MPLDPESIRLIQSSHPDIQFDWPQILKGRTELPEERPEAEPHPRRDRQPRVVERPDRRSRPERAPRREQPVESGKRTPTGPQREAPEPPAAEAPADESGPAAARLGSAGVARLRARYLDARGRIRERVEDDTRQTELNALAERLNPDAWLTEADVAAGLESYEATFEALKTAIGGRRKRAGTEDAPL